MSDPCFETLDDLARDFSSLRRGRKLHALAERRLAKLLQEIWPDAYPKPEPGETPGGRSDLAFYFPDGRYVVFEIFASVGQVAQDLRHLEQSNAQAQIAILTDRQLDGGLIYNEYYIKRPRDPFPVLDLSEVLVLEYEDVTKCRLRDDIDKAFAGAVEEEVSESEQRLVSRLAELALDDERRQDFGENEFTSGISVLDSRYVVIVAMPVMRVSATPRDVLTSAKDMLKEDKWYSATGDELPPRHWPQKIFRVPRCPRSGQNALVWEDPNYGGTSVDSRLAITDRAEVVFVSSEAMEFVTKLRDGTGVFLLARILAECWKLSGVVAQLYQDIGHMGQTLLCVAMVGTEGTHLGGVAPGFPDPCKGHYWFWVASSEWDWACHARNLKFCRSVDVLAMEPKKQPQFLDEFAKDISLAFNHDDPRCFDKKTGLIPGAYV